MGFPEGTDKLSSGSEQMLKIRTGHLAIPQNFLQQPWSDDFGSMYGHDRRTALRISKKVVTCL